jgi:proline racemase
MLSMKTIDAHAGGGPLRLVVDGFPAPDGATMADKGEWVLRRADPLWRALLLEPRGHADMVAAVLTEPVSPGSHAGVLFFQGDGCVPMCGHGVIAATTIALERRLVMPGSDGLTVVYDTAAGTVRARATPTAADAGGPAAEASAPRIERVSFVSVPSFVLRGGLAVSALGRRIRADVAFGGAFLGIVDAESVGLAVDGRLLPELRRAAPPIAEAIEAACPLPRLGPSRPQRLHGVVFTGPPHGTDADLRSVAVFAGGRAGRSPSGTGTAAILAVLDAMGLLESDAPFVHEGLIGSRFTGRVIGRTMVGEHEAIVPAIEGSAWITGEQVLRIHETDPYGQGFRV